jgi:ribonuclease T1
MQAKRLRVLGLVLVLALLVAVALLTACGQRTTGQAGAAGALPAAEGATATQRATAGRTPTVPARTQPAADATDRLPAIPFAQLPPEARETIHLIDRDGPCPYAQDGATFGNRERLLPARPEGYYREYTVRTPGSRDRGARRIVAGRGGELYHTDDHYESFKRVVR